MVLESSGVWHLTSFELVLSIKSIFIRLGPDWFMCCSGRVFGREGSHGPVHGEMEKVERKGSLAKSFSMRLFLTLHLCQFGLENLKIVVA